jgi:hypothetical protein
MCHNNFILEQMFWYQKILFSRCFLEIKMYHNNFILEQIF